MDNFWKVGRTNLFFTFTNQNQIYRQLFPRCLEGVKSAEESRFGTLLVHCATTDANPAQAFLVHDPSFERRRRPLGGVKLFYVVHEINADGGSCTSIQRAEDSRLARCGHNFNIRKSRIASE